MTAEPSRDGHVAAPDMAGLARRPSLTRSASLSRARRREELGRGNANALRHGIFAVVANLPDVATEVELQFTARPGLDRIRDRRLVEAFALAAVQHRRAIEAMATAGLTEHLTAYEARLAPLVERLERTIHERERERLSALEALGAGGLARYRSGGAS